MIKSFAVRSFPSKYDGSFCRRCKKSISVGTMIRRADVGYEHVECPLPTLEDRAAQVLANAIKTENLVDCTGLMTAITNGDAEGSATLAQATLDLIEDRLFSEYEAALLADIIAETPPEQRDGVVAPAPLITKGIYRVSLTGLEKRYGLDYVNIQLTPSPKYGSIKVGEYHGESLGRITREGSFVFWPSFEDRTSARTQALLAALDIIQGSQDPIQFAKAYAVESGTCFRCGADLVDEKSRERLLGPECYRRFSKGG